ncbi:biotin--[acetyl-CoA-carboxylase] ligase [uncultured Mycolicibacterium sp.]|uniref:biotin--[acetyl-CoA-carboxylase] ligase n=1 Tax=uncultured Mycolicibacterium sp. TaxID=2320817 RepID=UPI002605448D|nr:biotin--[acetyl-CoA-carboxylase] ligase [uncultured Mycolicibacterium sp.]
MAEPLPHPWQRLDFVAETGSTNADLLARAAAGEDIDGVVLATTSQTAGRGRHGRTWAAPPGAQLAVSAGIAAGAVPTEAWGWVPLLTGVAVVDAVHEVTGVRAGLKWPNDVLVGTRKLAGILAEVSNPGPVIVVGVGVNLSFTAEQAPDPNAVSLSMLGATADPQVLLRRLLTRLGERIAEWRAGGERLRADYTARSLTLGTEVRALLPGDRQLTGTARAVDEAGRLIIDTADGAVTVSAADITHLRPAG